jgi:hypothetical protein
MTVARYEVPGKSIADSVPAFATITRSFAAFPAITALSALLNETALSPLTLLARSWTNFLG